MSNTGGKDITKKVLDVWKEGKRNREKLNIQDFERLIEVGAFNEEGMVMGGFSKLFFYFSNLITKFAFGPNLVSWLGGLHLSHIIEKSLIDVYIPFLPMEKKHIRMCALNEFKKREYLPKNMEAALQ